MSKFDERLNEIVDYIENYGASGADASFTGYLDSRASAKQAIRTLILEAKRESHKDGYRAGVSNFSNYYMDASLPALRQQIMPHIALELLDNYRPPIYFQPNVKY